MARAPRAALLLAREAFLDALRRRTAVAVVLVAGLALLSVNRCTEALSRSTLTIDGQPIDMAQFGPVVGIPTFVLLSLLILAVAAILGCDALAGPMEDGEAALWLARPVGRGSYVLARFGGGLGLTLCAEALVLGPTAGLLYARQGLDWGPALLGALGCALGVVVVGALAMAASLYLPRISAVLLVECALFVVVVANFAALGVGDLTGWLGAVADWGPPLAAVVVHAVAPWSPGLALEGDLTEAMARLALWTAGSVALVMALFRRAELQSEVIG